jgi:hypothetical protein
MNNLTELETLLRSWKPRRASRAVRTRLFGEQPTELPGQAYAHAGGTAAIQPGPFRIGWLAPATFSLLLACVLFNQHNAFVLGQNATGGSLVAAAVSNQSAAAWLPGSFQRSHNSLPVDALEWAHGSAWASNVSSSPAFGRTN